MSRIVFMLEEASMKALLEGLLPRLFPGLDFLCLGHEGKSDLERSVPRKLRAWAMAEDQFVIVRDNDGGDCKALKAALVALCAPTGRGALVRIACQELEAWYFGQPRAMAEALGEGTLRDLGAKAAFRNPDAIDQPARRLTRLYPAFQKMDAARKMASHLSYLENRSPSFRALVEGVARITSRPLPG